MSYEFCVTLSLTLANPKQEDALNNHKAWVERCIKKFNKKCAESVVNQKKIKLKKISENEMLINLYSEVELGKAPGRSLTGFSKMLITDDTDNNEEYDSFFEDSLFHQKLFTTTIVEGEGVNVLTDAQVVKALVDYLAAPKSTMPDGKKRAFNEIKRIVAENNFIEE